MGFVGGIAKMIGGGIKSIAQTALRAVAPAATNLLKNIVGSGFDALAGAAKGLVSSFPVIGPLASKLLGPLIDKGANALKGLTQNGLESLVKSLVEKLAPRSVPGAPAGTPQVTVPALGTPARTSGTNAATATLNNVIQNATGRSTEDALANSASGVQEPKPSKPLDQMSEGEMIQYQQQMQKYARLMDMYSKLIQAQHDMKKGIIANFRV